MAKNLVIVESPHKAKTIQKYLGADYKVVASMGHIRDLAVGNQEYSLGVDINNNFTPIYEISALKKRNVKNINFIGIVGAPEGVKALQEAHPDVNIYLAALDEKLNEKGYIVPGLGDCGDRIFGTK